NVKCNLAIIVSAGGVGRRCCNRGRGTVLVKGNLPVIKRRRCSAQCSSEDGKYFNTVYTCSQRCKAVRIIAISSRSNSGNSVRPDTAGILLHFKRNGSAIEGLIPL